MYVLMFTYSVVVSSVYWAIDLGQTWPKDYDLFS